MLDSLSGAPDGRRRRCSVVGGVLLLLFSAINAYASDAPASIAEATEGYEHHPGFLDLYFSADEHKLYLAVPARGTDALYVNYLAAGVGSNDIGLDRGQIGNTRYVELQVRGDRVLIVQPNLDYRARSDNPDERRAVTEAFASSVLAALPIKARDDQQVLADLTDFAISDVHGVATRLKASKQGTYQLDSSRSLVLGDGLAAFEQNTVVEALLTFSGQEPGRFVQDVTPTPQALSVRIRHDFVAAPPPGFRSRAYHPRSGGFSRSYLDYASTLDQPLRKQIVVRHRLQLDPQSGKTVEPIVYYVDRGAPEPIRSALMEGASWWSTAFTNAGYADGFRVELLPEGVSPLDIRYNVIQWVHRATRGWSYGWGVIDPRTGEIVKGHVTLGSQRVRQDQLIAQALTAPFGEGGDSGAAARELALARLRQLAAHEVGHTLGLAHNFAASGQDDASVMDYPHPNIRLQASGIIDLSQAYSVGAGRWDLHAIDYLYRNFAEGDEQDGLQSIIKNSAHLAYLSDADSRSPSTAAPNAHLWDNGRDPLARLDELMRIRQGALNSFSADVLPPGSPLYEAEARLVPVYLLHRYQLEAVAKLVGGVDYRYGLRGEPVPSPTPVAAARQQQAIKAVLDASSVERLVLAEHILAMMQPPDSESSRTREYFTHGTGRVFDPLAPVRAGAQLSAQLLLDPHRAQRLVAQHARDRSLPSLDELLRQVAQRCIQMETVSASSEDEATVTWRFTGENPRGLASREIAWTFTRELQRLSIDPSASQAVRTATMDTLRGLQRWASERTYSSSFARQLEAELMRFLEEPESELIGPRHPIPPGSPI